MKKIYIITVLCITCVTIAFTSVSFALTPGSDVPTGGSNNTPVNVPTGGADNTPQPTAVSHLDNPLTGVTSLGGLVKSGLQVFSYIAVLFGVVMLIVVGLKYILAQGRPEEMKKATNWLLYIVIGIAIVIGARIAVSIVINTLSASGAVDPKVIQSAQSANN